MLSAEDEADLREAMRIVGDLDAAELGQGGRGARRMTQHRALCDRLRAVMARHGVSLVVPDA